MTRKATPAEVKELRELLAIVYENDTPADQFAAWTAALQDIDNALTCYRAIAAEKGV
jgi:hypothetical protein